tara:strand:- start:480 stop:1328 length:849 start_codon:yes stop_codon:yes gene_type:complete
MKKSYLLILTCLFILSCSSSSDVVSNRFIQKRKYTKGFNIKKQQKYSFRDIAYIKKDEETKTNPPHNKNLDVLNIESVLIASNNNSHFTNEKNIEKLIKEFSFKNNIKISESKITKASKKATKFIHKNPNILNQLIDCDLIIMRDGSEVSAKILEITQYEIKYKNCNNLEGPTFTKSLSSIFKINYANGTSQVMNSNFQNNNNSTNSLGLEEGEKSQSIAIALWFFLGAIGVHRFYLGHVGIGVLYLLTFGLCGIGWLIDGILFLTGDLKPADGKDYGEKIL